MVHDGSKSLMIHKPPSNEILLSLPNELWLEIFWHACSMPGVDEFSADFERHMDIYSVEGNSTTVIDHQSFRAALKCRLGLSLVCHGWTRLTTPILWSHLRISLDNFPTISNTLRLKPELGLYVRRITPMEEHLRLALFIQKYDDDNLLGDIIRLCPHLISVHVPILSDQLSYAFPPSLRNANLFWRFSRIGLPLLPPNLTSLTLELSHQPQWTSPVPTLQLPSLCALNICQLTLHEVWVDGITKNWDFPSLQILVISGGNWRGLVAILKRFAATLRTLKIYGRLSSTEEDVGDSIRLPLLSRLDILTYCEIGPLAKSLHLPNLTTLVVYWPYYQEIPFFDGAKDLSVASYLHFLNALQGWCPQSATIVFEPGDFVEWVIRQRAIATILTSMRNGGRRMILPKEGGPI